jgi:hypothetical protein
MVASSKRLRAALEAKQAELLTGRRTAIGIVIKPAAEEMDQVQHAAERDTTVSKLTTESLTRSWRRGESSRFQRRWSIGSCAAVLDVIDPHSKNRPLPNPEIPNWSLRSHPLRSAAPTGLPS